MWLAAITGEARIVKDRSVLNPQVRLVERLIIIEYHLG